MIDLRELYQEVILEHSKSPRNFGELKDANHCARGHNPLCGDDVTVYLKLVDGVVQDIRFKGKGCAICTASCSLMTETLKGKTQAEAKPLFKTFHSLVTQEGGDNGDGANLGKLKVFAGVREFPLRVKCATLPWHTFEAALRDADEEISTE